MGLTKQFQAGSAWVEVYESAAETGAAASAQAARIIRNAVSERGRARIVAATGNSQIPFVEALLEENIAWGSVELFHMDEYAGIAPDHPSSFRYWIRTRIEERARPAAAHYLAGDAADLEREIERYSHLLEQAPIDVAFVGFGENGHIAFNDPPVADFEDPATVKRVTLDEACRRQQAGEGHFADISSVPKQAITITCSGLFRARAWVCCVPEGRKAAAVRCALEGPISEKCPASLVRMHSNAHVYLDRNSASY